MFLTFIIDQEYGEMIQAYGLSNNNISILGIL